MARSVQKSPVISPFSAKFFKKKYHRALRIVVKRMLCEDVDFDNLVLPVIREMSNMYDSPKDGRCNYFGGPLDDVRKSMRK
jgi:hypothetical protein